MSNTSLSPTKARWAQLINEQFHSGDNITNWCSSHKVSKASFFKYKKIFVDLLSEGKIIEGLEFLLDKQDKKSKAISIAKTSTIKVEEDKDSSKHDLIEHDIVPIFPRCPNHDNLPIIDNTPRYSEVSADVSYTANTYDGGGSESPGAILRLRNGVSIELSNSSSLLMIRTIIKEVMS